MITTTLSAIKAHCPCVSGWRTLLTRLGKTGADDSPLRFSTIVETNGLGDALWALRTLQGTAHLATVRAFVVSCAELVLPLFEKVYPHDGRPRAALDAARKCINTPGAAEAARVAHDENVNVLIVRLLTEMFS